MDVVNMGEPQPIDNSEGDEEQEMDQEWVPWTKCEDDLHHVFPGE